MSESEKVLRIPTEMSDPDVLRAIEVKNYQLIQERIAQWQALLEKTNYEIDQLEGFQRVVGELDAKLQSELEVNRAGTGLITNILSSLDQVEAELQTRIQQRMPSPN